MFIYRYTNHKHELISSFHVPTVDAPELNISGEEMEIFTHAWFQVRNQFILDLV